MAYDTIELEKKVLEAIETHKLFFIEDIVAYLPCSRATFYNHKLDKLDTIKEALEKNRIEIKCSLRKKWYNSDSAVLQIALYKLIATDEESIGINSQKTEVEHSFTGKPFKIGFDADDDGSA